MIKKPLSNEIYVACIIYKENYENRPVGFNILQNRLNGELTTGQLQSAIDTLFDWGILKADYEKLTETTAGRSYYISEQSKSTIHYLCKEYIGLVELDQKVGFKYINATPDGNYALRILEAYLEDTKYITTDNTLGVEPESEFCKMLNDLQAKRADELREAIVKLRA